MYNTRSIKDKNVDEIKRKSSKTTIIVKNHLAVKNKQIANTLSKAEREQKITYERTKPIKSENPNSFGIEYEIPILTIKKDDFKNLKNNGEYSKNILTLDAEPFISEDFRDGGKRDIYIEFISKPMRFNNLEFIKNDSEERETEYDDYEWYKKENKSVRMGSMSRILGQRSKFRFLEHIKYICRTYFDKYNLNEYNGTPQITFGIELKRLPKLYREVCHLMHKTLKDNKCIDYYFFYT